VKEADDRVQVACAEVGIDKKGFEPLPGQEDSEMTGDEALSGSSLSSTDGPYMCHGPYSPLLRPVYPGEPDTQFP